MSGIQADFTTTKDLLESFGISIVGRSVRTREEAVATAAEIGFPCVMKLVSPDVIHKTDAGVVILDIESASMAGDSYDTILANGRQAGWSPPSPEAWPRARPPRRPRGRSTSGSCSRRRPPSYRVLPGTRRSRGCWTPPPATPGSRG